jgi:chromosome segregation ATPase
MTKNVRKRKENRMNAVTKSMILVGVAALVVTPGSNTSAAESAERAAAARQKIQTLREECAKVRTQVTITIEELNRLRVQGVDLRPQFDKFKAELAKMEEQAKVARDRANNMKENGQAAFDAWEKEVQAIQNEDIRNEAQKRYEKRKKSYDRIIAALQDAKKELLPFLADLNDISKLLESELNQSTVASSATLIKKATWSGTDVKEALEDVEKELDRVAADLAKYQ